MARPAATRLLATWGNGDFGRLGHGVECLSEELPRVVAALRDQSISQVACGGAHTVVVTESGALFSMGLNDYGQLGHTPGASYVPVPQQVSLPDPVASVSAGHFHTLAVTVAGEVWAWGRATKGCLGLGRGTAGAGGVMEPRRVAALKGVLIQGVAAGLEHSLAYSSSGELFTWGGSQHGKLGHGAGSIMSWLSSNEATPRQVRALANARVTAVAAGDTSSACLDEDGCVHTWGNGRFWQLGLGKDVIEADTPRQVHGLHSVQSLSLGGLYGAAVRRGGALMVWGSNEAGVLGMGRNSKGSLTEPARVPKLLCEQVSCGWKHAAMLTGHGAMYSMGWGGSAGDSYSFQGAPGSTGGQLGLGDDFDRWQPTQVEWLQMDETDVRHWRGDTGGKELSAEDEEEEEEGDGPTPAAGRSEWRFAQVSAGFNHTAAVVELDA